MPPALGAPICSITGANKGPGYETARQLTSAGHTVYVGARDRELGRQAAALKSLRRPVRTIMA
jgi:NAD(P)-dependent dehydrogenase (short-subunit alcohol dehydrogenase family)